MFFGCSSGTEVEIPIHVKELENLIVYPIDGASNQSIELHKETGFSEDKISIGWYDNGLSDVGWIAGLEVDNSGNVYIGDISSSIFIHVFGPNGRYVKQLGGKGSGPGEFSSISNMKIINDRLYIYDPFQFRINVFSLDTFNFSNVINVKPNAVNQDSLENLMGWFPYERFFIDENTFLTSFLEHPRDARSQASTYNLGKERIRKYYFLNRQGEIISQKLFEQRGPKDLIATVDGQHRYNFFPLPFLGNSLITISEDKYIFTNWTEDFLVKVYAPSGDYLRAFYYPFSMKKLNRDELINRLDKNDDYIQTLVRNGEIPEYWPVINSMVADDKNRLWLSTIPDSEDLIYEWWVLQDTGELIAKFRWPRNRSIEKIKDGYLYALETEESTGKQTIVKYRIEFN